MQRATVRRSSKCFTYCANPVFFKKCWTTFVLFFTEWKTANFFKVKMCKAQKESQHKFKTKIFDIRVISMNLLWTCRIYKFHILLWSVLPKFRYFPFTLFILLSVLMSHGIEICKKWFCFPEASCLSLVQFGENSKWHLIPPMIDDPRKRNYFAVFDSVGHQNR